jgi:hypothetical protein
MLASVCEIFGTQSPVNTDANSVSGSDQKSCVKSNEQSEVQEFKLFGASGELQQDSGGTHLETYGYQRV